MHWTVWAMAVMSALAAMPAMALGMVRTSGLEEAPAGFPLEGTWTLAAAEILAADGSRVVDPAYGADAKGLLLVDREGRYSLQIFRPDRPKFASGDKKNGTAEEYREAVLGMSTHAGRIRVDAEARTLTFEIELAAYPNWEGTTQVRQYELDAGRLSWRVPASAGAGRTAISVWVRTPINP
jgi:hypothetical protein